MPAAELERLSEALEEARQGTQRVAQIVARLRDFSIPGSEKRHGLDLQTIAETAIQVAHNEIKHRAQLVREYGPAPRVDGNQGQLVHAIVNLLVNAAQSIPEGKWDESQVRVVLRTDPSGMAVLEVRDTGTGIPADQKARIFDPFYTTRPVGMGMGLGLSVCHGIISAHNGTVEVQSQPGRGSVFTVRLPPSEGPTPITATRTPADTTAVKSGHVLVVDDDPLVGNAVRRALCSQHRVTVTLSAREALALLSNGLEPDLILCDVMMPEMSGVQLFKLVQATMPHHAERMVFITGGAFTESTQSFMLQMNNRRIDKPFEPVRLREMVAEWLVRGPAQPSVEMPGTTAR